MVLKKKQVLIVGGIVVVAMIILYAIGYGVGSKKLNTEAVTAAADKKLGLDEEYTTKASELENLNSQIAEKNAELQETAAKLGSTKEDLSSAESDLKASQDKLDTLADYDSKVQAFNDEIASLTSNRDALKGEVDTLTNDKGILQGELETLRGEIVKAAGEPFQLSPGFYYAGDDIKTGRYRVSNGSSNFFVFDADGYATVNIILDKKNDGLRVTDYIFDLKAGYTLETKNVCTLTPVE